MDILSILTMKENTSSQYSKTKEEYVDFLFKNKLETFQSNKSTRGFYRGNVLVDQETEYQNNSFGYRGGEWLGQADVLALGCSMTYGVGIPMDGSWPAILSKIINKNVRNLSQPGASINEIVAKAFKYFEIFGNPKTIVCLLPDPYRITISNNQNLITSQDKEDRLLTTVFLNGLHDIEKREKYLKKPYCYEDVLPQEVPIFFSTQYIHMLEQYCKSNNINLVWSTWFNDFGKAIDSIEDTIFNNFFYSNEFSIDLKDVETECHKEYVKDFIKYFDSGLDIEDNYDYRHPGVHKHIHIAEVFYDKIKEML